MGVWVQSRSLRRTAISDLHEQHEHGTADARDSNGSPASSDASGPSASDEAFATAVKPVMEAMRDSLAAAVDALPETIQHAADLRRALNLDSRLSTQIMRVARAEDVLRVASHVPGPPSMKRFLEALRVHGTGAELIHSIERAFTSFEQTVETQAGDRVSFDSIVANLGADGHDALELQHRRAAFRAMSHLLGMQMQAYARACVFCKAPGGRVDMAQLRAFLSVRRLRQGTPVPLFSANVLATHTRGDTPLYVREAIGQELAAGSGLGVVQSLSSPASSQVRLVEEMGMLSIELHGAGLGASASADLYFGYVDRAVPVHEAKDPENIGINHSFMIPAERFVMDFLCERGLMTSEMPSGMIYLSRGGRMPVMHRADDLLHMQSSVKRVRSIDRLTRDTSLGSYGQALQMTLDRMGWGSKRFDIFRVEIDFPVMGTLIRVGARVDAEQSTD
jgi:hypothetical protein